MLRFPKNIACQIQRKGLLLNSTSWNYVATKRFLRHNSRKGDDSTFGKWFLLIFPIGSLSLGTWQVYRKKWKLGLIRQLEERTNSPPRPLPTNLNELHDLEYYPLQVTGTFDHSKEILVGPRSLVKSGSSIDSGSLMSVGSKDVGAQVITPFHVENSDVTILVNRGYIPQAHKKPQTRMQGQVIGTVTIVGLLRRNEKRPPLSPRNMPQSGRWLYKDLDEMAKLTGASPILVDAVFDKTLPPGSPVGGQTRVNLRDEHLSYIVTWYGLAVATSIMWYYRFIK